MRITVAGAALMLVVVGCASTDEPRAHGTSSSAPATVPTATVTERTGSGPTSGYCALLVFDGRTYEVADGQQGTGVARPAGRAHGHDCGADGDTEVDVYTANEQPPEEALAASYGDRVIVYWPEHSAELSPVPYPKDIRSSGDITERDLTLVRSFAQFAVRPDTSFRDAVGFVVSGPEIGLGPTLQHAAVSDLTTTSTWSFPAGGFAGRTGQINVLDVLREHLMDTLFMRFTGPSDVVPDLLASAGKHTRCVGSPVDAPTRFAHLRHLSLEPDPATLPSCLDWFAIDLYLNRAGRVEAVSLDLLEP